MSSFDDFLEVIKEGAKDLAREQLGGFENDAKEDVSAFLEKTKDDLERWVKLLKDGEISEQDFKDLVEAKKALAEIHALTQKGIALTKLDKFRSSLIDLVVDTAVGIFL